MLVQDRESGRRCPRFKLRLQGVIVPPALPARERRLSQNGARRRLIVIAAPWWGRPLASGLFGLTPLEVSTEGGSIY